MTSTIAGSAPTDQTWRTFAVCREVDPELFSPVATSGRAYERRVAAAKSICANCPVVSQCLAEEFQLVSHGIAGGLTAEERRVGRRRRHRVEPDVDLPASTRSENAAIGAVLLVAGGSPTTAARRCRVTERTVYRWKAVAAAQHGNSS